MSEPLAEKLLGTSLVVLHEAAHTCTGHLLGLYVQEVQIQPGGGGFAIIGHDARNAADVARFGVACAIAPVLHERLRVGFDMAITDMDNVTIQEREYERVTNGSLYAIWAGARLVLDHPSFRQGMDRLIPLLEAKDKITDAEVDQALTGIPLIHLPDLPAPVPFAYEIQPAG